MNKFIVITGSPLDGLQVIGPFDSSDEAIEWATDKAIRKELGLDNSGDWWVAPLIPAKNE